MSYHNVKGTKDIYNSEAKAYQYVENLMSAVADIYGYSEMRPPILEHTEVFTRSVGESSDVVRKEMYTFFDKGERSLTLRPEFTAGIMRVITQNKLYATQDLPIKVFYNGPVFRYERPQLGRYRQFNQFGVECLGGTNYLHDVEVIALGYTILSSLGLEGVKIKINSLGDAASRDAYRQALKDYFKDKIDNMCEDCKARFETNPLRILDCKVPEDQEVVKGAPKMFDFLSLESKERFDKVLSALEEMEIPFGVDESLVRGLDYYSETVFEYHLISDKGLDYGAIGGGGHYADLIKEFGGPALEGIGFSFGVERVISLLEDNNLIEKDESSCDLYVIPLNAECQPTAMSLVTYLRCESYRADINLEGGKMPAQIKRALRKGAKYALIIGEDEINNETIIVKDLANNSQESVPFDDLLDYLDAKQGDECGCGCHHEHEHEEGEEHHCCCHHHDDSDKGDK